MSCALIKLFVFIVAEVFPALPHEKLDCRYTGDPRAVRKRRTSNQVRQLWKRRSNDYFKQKQNKTKKSKQHILNCQNTQTDTDPDLQNKEKLKLQGQVTEAKMCSMIY